MSNTSLPHRSGLVSTGWRFLHDALLNTQQDFTQGHIGRAIGLLAIPMVLEAAMESLFAIVDIFFVAKLGEEAMATVALTEGLLVLVYGMAMGMGMAATAIVARRIGEGDEEGANQAAMQTLLLGLVAAVLVGVIGLLAGPQLLALMGASPAVLASGSLFARVMLGGSGSVLLLFLLNAVFRGTGDAVMAMRVLWFGNLLNIVLDACLIFGLGPFPKLGVTGAAVATTTGRTCAVLMALYYLWQPGRRVTLKGVPWRIQPTVMMSLLRLSLTGMVQNLIATASWLWMTRTVAVFGSAALAGYTLAIRILIFSLLPSWGMGGAAATLVGQNLGAGQPERAAASVWRTCFYNMLYLGMVMSVFLSIPGPLVSLFTQDPAIVSVATTGLRLLSLNLLLYAYGLVIVQAFNGAGDVTTPAIINFTCYWLLQIPLAYALAFYAGFGINGVWYAIVAAEAMVSIVGIIVFRQGRWKSHKV